MKNDIIAVFGGTFDPPHNGHLGLAGNIVSSGAAGKVVFVPAFKPPHKPAFPVSDFDKRLEMLKIATSGKPQFSVSDIEGGRKGPSYTYDTLEAFTKQHPGAAVKLLVGSDSLEQLHTWYRARDIVAKWPLIVYPRKGYIPSREELRSNWGTEVAEKLLGYILPMPFYETSSTEVRDRLCRGLDVSGLLDPDVQKFVMENGIYNKKENGGN